MKIKKWIIAEPDESKVHNLAAEGKFTLLTAEVLCARNLNSIDSACAFLSCDPSNLNDPYRLKDMDLAVLEIQKAIDNGDKIAVFGDYDVDGVTSTCVLVRYLRSEGANCVYYIPDRISEGYGLNKPAIKKLYDEDVRLVVTVDSGITAAAEIEYALSLGLRVVITDHHECKTEIPSAQAVVNPKRSDCTYPCKDLAGVGVAFKLVCALAGKNRQREMLDKYADLVAIGTIADVMPLHGENRIIVSYGLKLLEQTRNCGLKMLMHETGIEDKKMTSGIVSFILAPRINAAGRLGCASQAVEMCLTDDLNMAQSIAGLLCQQNKDRQAAENDILQQAVEKLKGEYNPEEDKMIVLWGDNWHHGVIGIVSSRISDRYSCPAVLISLDGDIGKGSGRSVKGFNLFEALEHASPYLEKFGGHELAAGLSVSRDNLEDFKSCICHYAKDHINPDDLIPLVSIDCRLRPEDITEENIVGLSALEPYGMGNPQPIFCMENMLVEEITPISSDKHLKMILSKNGVQFTAMLFGTNSLSCGFVQGNTVDAAFHLEINEFRGRRNLQLMLKDIRLSTKELDEDENFLEIYTNYMDGGMLTDYEVERLLPERTDLVAVWRHVISRAQDMKLSVPYNALSRRVQWESKRDINIGKLFVCLDVFSESQLLSYNYKDGLLNIYLKHFEGKADISHSVVLSTLKNMKKA